MSTKSSLLSLIALSSYASARVWSNTTTTSRPLNSSTEAGHSSTLISGWTHPASIRPTSLHPTTLHPNAFLKDDTVVCSFSTSANDGDTCASFAGEWGLTQDEFVSINPGVVCPGNLVGGQSYCVVGSVSTSSPTGGNPPPTTSPTTTQTTTQTTSSAPQVPEPTQSGLAANCDNYYLVAAGDSCDQIEAKYGISAADFGSWNPAINSQCTNLLSGYYVCVGVPGAKTTPPTTSTTLKTSTKPTSTAPEPTQSGLAANCDKYYLVATGDSCDQIEAKYGISVSQFSQWNPSINSQCTNLLSGYYVCVGVPGATTTPPTKTTPKTTTTKPANGINTPTPTQSGMATDCNKFDLVKTGDTCDAIATEFEIPIAKFYAWNPAVGSSCQTLLAGYYVCVDRLEYKPTTTTSSKGNGIATPTPYEPGMVTNCDKFYKVKSGDTCDSIASAEKVTAANIEKWNPKVGSSCTGLYLNYYICVGVK